MKHIPASEHAQRRKRFFELMQPNAIVLFPSADDTIASHDILNTFRQDSVFYHLFGVNEPMRRSFSPSRGGGAENFKLTCAILAKASTEGESGGGGGGEGGAKAATQTLLFVPGQTSDLSVLPWSEPAGSVEGYQQAVAAPGAEETVRVAENDLETLLTSVTSLITSMVEDAVRHRSESLRELLQAGRRRKPSALRAANPLPRLYVHLPQQLRWTREAFVFPEGDRRNGAARAVFTHPLEALLHLLYSLEVAVAATREDAAALCCRYQQPSHRPLLPGIAYPTQERRRLLQTLFPEQLLRRCRLANNGVPSEEMPLPCAAGVALTSPIQLPTLLLTRYRCHKAPSQVVQHVYSAAATHVAFSAAMKGARQSTSERTIHAAFQAAICGMAAASAAAVPVRSAYTPVVAVGSHATRIHYTRNDQVGNAGDLCRLDAGAEWDLVPTDCTRTFPVGDAADFWRSDASPSRKRALYEGVLALQRELLRSIASGTELRCVSDRHIGGTKELIQKLLADAHGEVHVPTEAVCEVLCAHHFGHPFGLDIHETMMFPQQRIRDRRSAVFTGGMMHTVEPGVYIPSADSALYSALKSHSARTAEGLTDLGGVGVQIEDDILVLPHPLRANDNAAECPWTRAEYLEAVHEAYDQLERTSADTFFLMGSYGGETEEQLQRCREQLSREQWIALLLVFHQRLSLEGVSSARARLAVDALRVKRCVDVRRETAWYPFHIVVLTAFVAKDVELLEYVVSGDG